MSYLQTNGIVSATPATVVMTAVEAQLTAHPAWDFVKEVVEGGFTTRVWKCLGAFNSTGLDFFVAFLRTTATIGTTNIFIKMAEEFNTTTNVVTKFAPVPSNTGIPSPTDGTTTAAGVQWSSTVMSTSFIIGVRTTAFNFFMQTTNDFLCFYSSPTTSPTFVGVYEPYWKTTYPAHENPLVIVRVGLNDFDDGCAFTRNPAPGSLGVNTADAFGGMVADPVTKYFGQVTTAGTVDTLAGVVAVGSKFLVLDALSRPRGELPDDILIIGMNTGIVETDTVDIGSETYVFLTTMASSVVGIWMNTET